LAGYFDAEFALWVSQGCCCSNFGGGKRELLDPHPSATKQKVP